MLRYEYETHNADELAWIPGGVSLTDLGTKTDSPLSAAVELTTTCGKIIIDVSQQESRSADNPLG